MLCDTLNYYNYKHMLIHTLVMSQECAMSFPVYLIFGHGHVF